MINIGYDDGFHDGFHYIPVGGIPTPLKNDGVKVGWGYELPNIWKNKKCSKPPTSYGVDYHSDDFLKC